MLGQDNIVKVIIKGTIILLLILVGIIFMFIKGPKPYILGLIFSTSIGILTFILMGRSAEKAVTMTPARASAYMMGQYFLRMLIYAVVLIVGALADYLSFLTVALGLLMIKLVIVSLTLVDTIKNKFK